MDLAVYLIDYENVNTDGLNGISRLSAEDTVIIFYSENADRMTFGLHRRLNESKATIDIRKVDVGGSNALDFQLGTYLGYLIALDREQQYNIVSNDRGYKHVANFWNKQKAQVRLIPEISVARPEQPRAEQTRLEPARTEPAPPVPAATAQPVQQAKETGKPQQAPAVQPVPAEEPKAAEPKQPAAPVLPAEQPAAPAPVIPAAPAAEPVQKQLEPAKETEPDKRALTSRSRKRSAPGASTVKPAPKPGQSAPKAAAAAPKPEQPAAPAPKLAEPAVKAEAPAEKPAAPKAPEQPAAEPAQKAAEQSAPKASRPAAKKPAAKQAPKAEKKPEAKAEQAEAPAAKKLAPGALAGILPEPAEAELVEGFIEKYKTKQGLNNALVRKFGNARGGELYQKLKPLIADKKGC